MQRYEYRQRGDVLPQNYEVVAEKYGAQGWRLLWPPVPRPEGFGSDLMFERPLQRDPLAVEEAE